MWYTYGAYGSDPGIYRATSTCCDTPYSWFVLAAASGAGAAGSMYRTEVEINSASDAPAEYRFAWFPRDRDNTEWTRSGLFQLQPGSRTLPQQGGHLFQHAVAVDQDIHAHSSLDLAEQGEDVHERQDPGIELDLVGLRIDQGVFEAHEFVGFFWLIEKSDLQRGKVDRAIDGGVSDTGTVR